MMKFVALAAVAALAASPAFAADAQLGSVKGSVLVNGKAPAAALKAGDRVVAAKGSAKVKFADGCVVELKANSMVTVAAKSPCASGIVATTSADTAQAAMFGASALTVAGTVVVAGAVILGATNVLDDSQDSITTSP